MYLNINKTQSHMNELGIESGISVFYSAGQVGFWGAAFGPYM